MSFDLEKARATYSAGCAEDAANLVPDLIARIQELEDALAEYQRLGKIMEGRLPCLTLHGECERCSSRAKEVCDAMHQIAEGKIGPEDVKPRSWQITDERILAIENAISSCVLIEMYTGLDLQHETTALRAMLKEVGQE